ncbi:MAG: hypothetical protein PUP92_28405, partial [Rhizonema sp. PD38]|nr:hypothetical protein [Rhizonema sp. PD38]
MVGILNRIWARQKGITEKFFLPECPLLSALCLVRRANALKFGELEVDINTYIWCDLTEMILVNKAVK